MSLKVPPVPDLLLRLEIVLVSDSSGGDIATLETG